MSRRTFEWLICTCKALLNAYKPAAGVAGSNLGGTSHVDKRIKDLECMDTLVSSVLFGRCSSRQHLITEPSKSSQEDIYCPSTLVPPIRH